MVSDKLTGWLGVKRRAARTPALGSRELAVLEILWRDGELSALQVLSRMSASSVTLSTVQSTLERLHRKDLTIRNKSGRAYYYQATLAKSDIIGNLLRDIAEDFAGGDMGPMISGFMEYIASAAPEMESDIAQALEHKKKNVLLQKTEGSLSNAAEGSLPSTAEGSLPNTAEGSIDD